MVGACAFCLKSATAITPAGKSVKPWDCILFESMNFIVFPTKGAIVQGWLLLAPKAHYLSMCAVNPTLLSELRLLTDFVSVAVRECFGDLALFEHGPVVPRQSVGCGVDHAHFHFVPTSCDLIDGLRGVFFEDLHWQEVQGISDAAGFPSSSPYLYVEQPFGRAFLTSHPRLGSQLFRRVIATHMGRQSSYDWRVFPEEQNAWCTAARIEAWKERKGVPRFVRTPGSVECRNGSHI